MNKDLEQFVSAGQRAANAANEVIERESKQMRLGYATPVLTVRERMTLLAASFPELERRAPIHPFDALELARWAKSGAPGHGGRCAALFVLSVWNPYDYAKWKAGRFDVHEALGVWDDDHRAAFLAWVKDPWWP